jgi:hypothetical protein
MSKLRFLNKIMDLLVYLIGVLVAFFIGYLIGNKQLE